MRFVDDEDIVWVTDLGSNALVRPGEVWGAESGTDKLVALRAG